MKTLRNAPTVASVLLLAAMGALSGCSSTPKSPDVGSAVRRSLDGAGFRDVTVSQDREKGVVVLGGHVPAEGDKIQAEAIAKGIATPQVVADEIAVLPPNDASAAKAVNADLDKGIEKNLDAALIQGNLKDEVSYDVKNGVVTLSGNVNSSGRRARAQSVAAGVPNVQQVVNEIQVKGQKATATP